MNKGDLPGYSISIPMAFGHSIGNRRYCFVDLRELLAKATPLRSGDAMAGLAATSAEERVAAQCALADQPLAHFLSEQVIPYEDDEVNPVYFYLTRISERSYSSRWLLLTEYEYASISRG